MDANAKHEKIKEYITCVHTLGNILIENGCPELKVKLDRLDYWPSTHYSFVLDTGAEIKKYKEVLKEKNIHYFDNKIINIGDDDIDAFLNTKWKTLDDKSKHSCFREIRKMYNIYLKLAKK